MLASATCSVRPSRSASARMSSLPAVGGDVDPRLDAGAAEREQVVAEGVAGGAHGLGDGEGARGASGGPSLARRRPVRRPAGAAAGSRRATTALRGSRGTRRRAPRRRARRCLRRSGAGGRSARSRSRCRTRRRPGRAPDRARCRHGGPVPAPSAAWGASRRRPSRSPALGWSNLRRSSGSRPPSWSPSRTTVNRARAPSIAEPGSGVVVIALPSSLPSTRLRVTQPAADRVGQAGGQMSFVRQGQGQGRGRSRHVSRSAPSWCGRCR